MRLCHDHIDRALIAETWILSFFSLDLDDLGMSFGGFDDTTPGWGVPTPTAGDIVTNAIRKEKLIKCVTFGD